MQSIIQLKLFDDFVFYDKRQIDTITKQGKKFTKQYKKKLKILI